MFRVCRPRIVTWTLLLLAAAAPACARRSPTARVVIKPPILGDQIYGDSLPPKTVVLSYDDGPDESTLEIARYLAEKDIPVTFFVNGSRFCRKPLESDGSCRAPPPTRKCDDGQAQAAVAAPRYYPESLIGEVLALGHRVGNHTQDHCHLTTQTNVDNLEWELQTTQEILDRHICDGLFLFRPPFGHWDKATAERLAKAPVWKRLTGPINWDIDGEDWSCWQSKGAPEQCADNYLKVLAARPNQNGIFILHDRPEFNVGSRGPLEMTKLLIPKLQQAGYQFATIDDVLRVTATPDGAGCKNGQAPR
jgi:peptidoglycan/xylan/chitin deacetylase (PgdA/CDA1 family)